jgi:predicted transcriptional regulator
MPFAVRFVEERLRISRNTANRAITRLVDAGVLVISGHEPSRCGKPTPVYVPGGPR